MVDLGGVLKSIRDASSGEEKIAGTRERKSRQVRLGIKLDRGNRYRIEARLGDDVAWQRCAQPGGHAIRVENRQHAAGGVAGVAEVPFFLERGRQGMGCRGNGSRFGALVVEKEERLILAVIDLGKPHRAADRAAELIAARGDDGSSIAIREEVIRIESAVTEEVE